MAVDERAVDVEEKETRHEGDDQFRTTNECEPSSFVILMWLCIGSCGGSVRSVAGVRRGEFGHEEGSAGSHDTAKDEGKGEFGPTAFRRMHDHRCDRVDDWRSSKNDGHYSCRGCDTESTAAFDDGRCSRA